MIESPNIIVRTKFYPSKPNIKNIAQWATRRAFYTCNSAYNILDYLSRESATSKSLSEEEKEIIRELENQVVPENSIIDYISERPGAGGLFSKDGLMSEEEIKQAKDKMKTTGSIVWEGFISFETKYGKENCNSYDQAMTLMNKAMPSMLKHSHLDYDNMEWFAGFHTNTDNYHIQFVMFEKEPQHITKSGDLSFSNKGQIAKHNFDNAKFCIEKELTFEKDISFQKRNEIKSSFSKALWTQRKESLFEDDILELASKLPSSGRLAYDSENMQELKPLVNKITTNLIQNCPEIKEQYNDYKNYVVERKNKLEAIYSKNNIKKSDKLNNYVNDRIDDLYNRLGNITIKTAQNINKKSEQYTKTKTTNPTTKVYRNNKKKISLAKASSSLLSMSEFREESLKAVKELKRKLEESEEIEMQQAKIGVIYEAKIT